LAKITIVINSLGAGGAEKFIANFVRSLAKRDYEVDLVTVFPPAGEVGRQLEDNLLQSVKVIRYSSNLKILQVLAAVTYLLYRRPHIILYCGSISELCAVVYKIIAWRRVELYSRIASTKNRASGWPYLLTSLSIFLRTRFIFISNSVRDCFNEDYKNVNRDNFAVIPNGYSNIVRQSPIHLTDEEFVIGHVGAFRDDPLSPGICGEAKAHDIVVKSFRELLRNKPNAKLIMYGEGPLRCQIEHLVETLDIQRSVTFIPSFSNVDDAMAKFDIFFFPSRYEGMPNALIEAAISGLPIVASNIPEIRSLSCKNWLLSDVDNNYEFAHSLLRVANDLVNYKKNAYVDSLEYEQSFSMENCLNSYLKYLQANRYEK
jgi:glycosyltransferase involved in cell wall biosynthesis